MSHYLQDLIGTISLAIQTKKILTLDTVIGWARESLVEDGFLTIERVEDGNSWIVEARIHFKNFKVAKTEKWRANDLSADLIESFYDLPVICKPLKFIL